MKNVQILGSCVTRDAMEFEFAKCFKLIDYNSRTSLASLAGRRHSDARILDGIDSPFQRRMVERDMKKGFWPRLEQSQAQVLLLDFVDDRFNIRMFNDGRTNTISAEYYRSWSRKSEENETEIDRFHPEFTALWDKGMTRLKRTLEQRKDVRVFVNCVYFIATGDEKLDKFNRIDETNEYLASVYEKCRNHLSSEALITYPPGVLSLDTEHKWGLAPFHYSYETYRHFIMETRRRLDEAGGK